MVLEDFDDIFSTDPTKVAKIDNNVVISKALSDFREEQLNLAQQAALSHYKGNSLIPNLFGMVFSAEQSLNEMLGGIAELVDIESAGLMTNERRKDQELVPHLVTYVENRKLKMPEKVIGNPKGMVFAIDNVYGSVNEYAQFVKQTMLSYREAINKFDTSNMSQFGNVDDEKIKLAVEIGKNAMSLLMSKKVTGVGTLLVGTISKYKGDFVDFGNSFLQQYAKIRKAEIQKYL